jgi:hypothetical protein
MSAILDQLNRVKASLEAADRCGDHETLWMLWGRLLARVSPEAVATANSSQPEVIASAAFCWDHLRLRVERRESAGHDVAEERAWRDALLEFLRKGDGIADLYERISGLGGAGRAACEVQAAIEPARGTGPVAPHSPVRLRFRLGPEQIEVVHWLTVFGRYGDGAWFGLYPVPDDDWPWIVAGVDKVLPEPGVARRILAPAPGTAFHVRAFVTREPVVESLPPPVIPGVYAGRGGPDGSSTAKQLLDWERTGLESLIDTCTRTPGSVAVADAFLEAA